MLSDLVESRVAGFGGTDGSGGGDGSGGSDGSFNLGVRGVYEHILAQHPLVVHEFQFGLIGQVRDDDVMGEGGLAGGGYID